jgi:hypothetical protein
MQFLPTVRFISSVLVLASSASLVACGGSAPPPASQGSVAAVTATSANPPAVKATKPESDKVTWKKDPVAKNCHKASATADLVSATTGIAGSCVDVTKMKVFGSPTSGEGQASTDTMVKSIPLAAKANHCYRVFGLAEATVTDFDIAVMDSAGKLAGEDTTDANDAIVLEDGSICFSQDDAAMVNTAVAAGKGKWAVEIWSD